MAFGTDGVAGNNSPKYRPLYRLGFVKSDLRGDFKSEVNDRMYLPTYLGFLLNRHVKEQNSAT
jgi:hypothetical protein